MDKRIAIPRTCLVIGKKKKKKKEKENARQSCFT